VVLGCRALLLLHDEQGHPLFVTTHRGDQHLTVGISAFLERYEQHAGNSRVTRMTVDREGMATEFLARLHAEGRQVVTSCRPISIGISPRFLMWELLCL
jgi:hypothetical protein